MSVVTDTQERVQRAKEVAALLNDGATPTEALRDVGVNPEAVFAEEALDLDDRDNDIVDFGWDRDVLVVVRRFGPSTDWEVHKTVKVA